MNRIIEYTESITKPFQRYIDIGWCEIGFGLIRTYDPDNAETYDEWFKELINESLGYQILVLNHLLSEYNSEHSIKYFKDSFGTKIYTIITDNLDLLDNFNNQWFYEDAPLFKGLDFGYYEKDDEVIETIENDEGIRLEVKFEDESIMKFLDEDGTTYSYYVLESEFENFKNEVENIIELFK